jgi:hypothetical protein
MDMARANAQVRFSNSMITLEGYRGALLRHQVRPILA